MIEFLGFVIILILLIWIARISSRVSLLERKLRQSSVMPSQPVAFTNPDIVPKPPASPQHGFLQPHPQQFTPAFGEPILSQSDVSQSKPMTEAKATEIASNWLNKIGVVALLLGMVFFFKYAVDQGWVSPWMRIIIGFVVSGLLVYLGELWKEKYGNRAYGLSGGGIALFYFSIFAAYQFYHIMPQPVAWVCMLAVAALSIYLSFRYSSLVLGVLGFFGAYGSPLMLNSGHDQQISLFVFLVLMNLVALIICVKKFWVELLFLGLLGTVIDYLFWANNYSSQQNTFNSVFFIIFTTFILVLGSTFLLRFHKAKDSLPKFFEKNLSALYIFSGSFFFFGLWVLLWQNFHNFLAPLALLGAVIFFFAYALVDRLEYRAINYCLSFAGSALLVYATIWQFHDKALGLALLLLSLFGASIGFLLKREELRVWSLIVLFMSLFHSLFQPYGPDDKVFLFNAKFGLMFANTLGLLFAGWLYRKFEASKFEQNVEQGLQIVASLVLWFGVSWDIFSAWPAVRGTDPAQTYMTFWWVLYPAVLALTAFISKRKGLMRLALGLLFASVIKVLILPYADNPALFVNAKFGLMLMETLALFFVGTLYAKSEGKPEDADALHVIASIFLWFAVSWEIVEYFRGSQSVNGRNLYLSLWWVVYAVALMAVGGISKRAVFRKLSIGLFALSILKVFLYDVQVLDTPYRIVSFIVLGVILLAVSFSYRKNKEKIVHFLEGEKTLQNNSLL